MKATEKPRPVDRIKNWACSKCRKRTNPPHNAASCGKTPEQRLMSRRGIKVMP